MLMRPVNVSRVLTHTLSFLALCSLALVAGCGSDETPAERPTPEVPIRAPDADLGPEATPAPSPDAPRANTGDGMTEAPADEPDDGEPRVEMGERPTTVQPTAPRPVDSGEPRSIGMPRPDQTPPSADPSVAVFAGLAAPKQPTWQWRQPSSMMRVAEYAVPGVEGADQASIIVYQFAGGGTPQSNIDRWKTQFKRDDGQAIEAKVQELEADGMKVTVAELAGDYRGMGMTEHARDHTLIAAMVQTDGDPVFIQFVGPSKTVDANREAYMTMLRGIRRHEPMK